MNHDNAHCLDYCATCPKDCYRAQLTVEAVMHHLTMVAFTHFKGTEECKLTEKGEK